MVAHAALVLQQVQALAVGAELEGLVEKIGLQRLENVHRRQQLQQVPGAASTPYDERSAGSASATRMRRNGGGTNQCCKSCSRMAETASSDASMWRRVGLALACRVPNCGLTHSTGAKFAANVS